MTVALHTKRGKAPALWRGLRFARAAVFLFTAISLFSCVSAPLPQDENHAERKAESFCWRPVTAYADYAVSGDGGCHCVRIDLTAPGLRIVSYPDKAGRFAGKTTVAFARETGAQVAVNATPFAGKFLLKRTVGVHVADGKRLSAPVRNYDALVFEQTAAGLRARMVAAQDEARLAGAAHAFGGFWMVVRGGVKQEFERESHDARTAAGISADGHTLYLLAAERSAGLSFQQCADMFLALGVTDALQLDGGHSSDLVLHGKSVFSRMVRRGVGVSFGFIGDGTADVIALRKAARER